MYQTNINSSIVGVEMPVIPLFTAQMPQMSMPAIPGSLMPMPRMPKQLMPNA